MTWLNKKGALLPLVVGIVLPFEIPVFDGMAEALKKRRKPVLRILKRIKLKKLRNSALIVRKLVYKSKNKGSSGFTNREFNTLMVLTKMTLMN